jgi:thiosulfate reductase cytochrome b subunit
MPRIVRKHPLAIRWMHWVNFPVLLAMVWSGILILWAYDAYPTTLWQAGHRLIRGKDHEEPPVWLKVPDKVVVSSQGIVSVTGGADEPVGLPKTGRIDIDLGYRLADGMAWHFALAWIFTLNGIAYALYLALSGAWRHIAPRRDSLRGALRVVWKDLAFWRRPELADGGIKYNDAQRIAYTGVILLGALMVVTGLAIYKPAHLAWLTVPFGGYQGARMVHFLVTALLVAFFFVHVAQVARAGFNNFRGMLTGWEVEKNR